MKLKKSNSSILYWCQIIYNLLLSSNELFILYLITLFTNLDNTISKDYILWYIFNIIHTNYMHICMEVKIREYKFRHYLYYYQNSSPQELEIIYCVREVRIYERLRRDSLKS